MKKNRSTVILLTLAVLVAGGSGRAEEKKDAANAQQLEVASLLSGQDIYYDADGLIVHRPTAEHPFGDGGDTAQREGWYWLGVWIRQNTPGMQSWTPPRKLTFRQVLRLLEPNGDGVFYRHPKLAPWNNPHEKRFGFSRDQMIPLVAAMGVWGMRDEIRRLWDALPESALGKHSFNGNWRNALGQDGWDCSAIQKRGCDATRDCSLKTDTRDCSLKVDTRSCPLQEDTRSCSTCLISNPFGGCILYGNDPVCEVAKATQNAIYKAAKDKCEVEKAAQNVLYAGEKATCEAAKATQNAIYKAEKDTCEVAKAAEKGACELQKAADLTLCRLSNVHSGDLVGPSTVNLFRRAMGENPMVAFPSALQLPPVNYATGALGESELFANALLRIQQGSLRDNTGDDLNLIVMMLMSKLRFPSPESEASVALYAGFRPFSYGSYLETYYSVYGADAFDMQVRIANGIRSGWKADAAPANGAVRWYHRAETGGNPQLAYLYDPIIDRFIYGDLTGSTRTAAKNPPPTIAAVTPGAGLPGGGTAITIAGTNFIRGTTVLVGGVAATDVVVADGATITAVTPSHAAGDVDVSVTVPWPGGGTAIMEAGFTYAPTVSLDRSSVWFGATNSGHGFRQQTPTQAVHIEQNAGGKVTWTATPSHPWITVSPSTGTGPATLQVGVAFSGGLPASGTLKGSIVLSFTGAANTPGPIAVGLRLTPPGRPAAPVLGDFDGDIAADLALFSPTTGKWTVLSSSTAFRSGPELTFGSTGDKPVPGDYDGDGRVDVAFYRPSDGMWNVIYSSTGSLAQLQWGVATDIPMQADFTGDGRTDLCVWRPSTGVWYIFDLSTGTYTARQWGVSTDIPLTGDYDGDGLADVAVFRPSNGFWYVFFSSNQTYAVYQWGISTDIPLPADYSGDGRTDIAVYRPSTGVWFVYDLRTSSYVPYQWGVSTDVPVPNDYDGDGRADLAIWRPSTGTWFIYFLGTNTYTSVAQGVSGDVPIK